MDSIFVISGHDLKQFLLKANQPLADIVDVKGTNIIDAVIVQEDNSIRAYMLVKCIKRYEALETRIDFPMDVFTRLRKEVHMPNKDSKAN